MRAGYHKDSLVGKSGEFAIRGDILDIYPLDRENPVRIEFFGDEIDSIKEFDLSTQRSQKELDKLTIFAAQDRVFSGENLKKQPTKLEKQWLTHPLLKKL